VGKRKLGAAIALAKASADPALAALDFVIEWKPFFLSHDAPRHPDAPLSACSLAHHRRRGALCAGVAAIAPRPANPRARAALQLLLFPDKMEHYNAKFGASRVAAMIPQMKRNGLSVDPPIRFSYGGTIGSTLDSHRLISWSMQRGGEAAQDKFVEAAFSAYFEQEKNIASHDVLLEAVGVAGLDVGAARAFLASDELERETLAEASALQRGMQISGVPYFVMGDKYAVSGAQDSAAFLRVFAKLAEEAEK